MYDFNLIYMLISRKSVSFSTVPTLDSYIGIQKGDNGATEKRN